MTASPKLTMPAGRAPADISMSEIERATLNRWIRARSTPQALVMRCRIVLMLADGLSARAVARDLDVSRRTVDLWRDRYLAGRCDALTRERPGRGRKPAAARAVQAGPTENEPVA